MDVSVFDNTTFNEMKEMMGEAFKDVISLTVNTLPEQLTLLDEAIKQKNAEAIFNSAHRIKSASGTIGASGLAQKAEAIEMMGRAGNASIPEKLIEDIHHYTNETIRSLNESLAVD